MGATNFATIAFGKDAAEAFRTAQERSLHEHGHNGYTGTIAEKSGFTLARPCPMRVDSDRAYRFIQAADQLGYETADAKRNVEDARTKTARTKAEREQRAAERRFNKAVPAKAREWAKSYADAYSDKYGPAVAIEITDAASKRLRKSHSLKYGRGRFYLFFGLARM